MLQLQVCERGTLVQGEKGTSSLRQCWVPTELFERLQLFEDRRVNRGESPVFTWGYRKAVVGPYVGVIRVPGLQLEILPKTERVNPEPSRLRRLLIGWLRWAGKITVQDRDEAYQSLARFPLHEILRLRFASGLLEQLRQGTVGGYVAYEESLSVLRGRLDLGKQLARNMTRKDRFACQFEEFSADTLLTQVLKATALRMLGLGEVAGPLLRQCLFLLDEVSDLQDPRPCLDKVQITRQNERFAECFRLACLFWKGCNPTTASGNAEEFALLYQMDELFESFIAGFLMREVMPGLPGYTLHVQARGHTRHLLTEPNAYRLEPDLLVYGLDNTVGIIDTKWKVQTEQERKGSKQSDIYQLYTYLRRFNASKAILLYPKTNAASKQTWQAMDHSDTAIGEIGSVYINMDLDPTDAGNRAWLKFKLAILVQYACGKYNFESIADFLIGMVLANQKSFKQEFVVVCKNQEFKFLFVEFMQDHKIDEFLGGWF
jgi:5-methylcytosine-specific restriction enzyme subunit McrC